MSQSVKLAGIIALAVIFYFLVRGLFGGGPADTASADATHSAFTVLAETIAPVDWRDEIIIRGRTEAEKKVVVRAETSGVVTATPAELGAIVQAGDTLCKIDVDARQAQLAEARAALAKAQLDYEAAVKLNQEGFRAETGVAAAKAARDQAAAQAERARLELSKTDIKAPFDGVFDHRNVETGDFLNVGQACGTVIQPSPFLVVGAVSERDVGKIHKGDKGAARLATGEMIDGVVRFVASAADPATRTFKVELEVPNEDGKLRDGVTADFTVFAQSRQAYRIPRSALVLNDEGAVGVRTLSADNEVRFEEIALLGEEAEGVFVTGLTGEPRVITRGQEFVSAGQIVNVADPNEGGPS